MSQTEESYVQLTFEDLKAEDSAVEEEYSQSLKGNLQIAEEEPKANKSKYPPFLNWDKTNPQFKTLFFPRKDPEGNLNTGKIVYKVYLPELEGKNKNIAHDTLEEFESDERYINRKDVDQKPKLRYYVYVVELTPNGNVGYIWDMAKTKYLTIFTEYLDKNTRVLSIKPAKDAKDAPIVKIPTDAQLKALIPSSK